MNLLRELLQLNLNESIWSEIKANDKKISQLTGIKLKQAVGQAGYVKEIKVSGKTFYVQDSPGTGKFAVATKADKDHYGACNTVWLDDEPVGWIADNGRAKINGEMIEPTNNIKKTLQKAVEMLD